LFLLYYNFHSPALFLFHFLRGDSAAILNNPLDSSGKRNSPAVAGLEAVKKLVFLTGQPRFAFHPSGSRAAKRKGKPPETGDPLRRLNRRSRNARVKGRDP